MRTWLYDTLVGSFELRTLFEYNTDDWPSQVMPRESQSVIPHKPFIIYGLGNNTNEDLSEDPGHEAHRQFFQIWLHDEGGDYQRIDDALVIVKALLINKFHVPSKLTTVRWLENSQEFSNETYNSIFRYARFQAIISKGVTAA